MQTRNQRGQVEISRGSQIRQLGEWRGNEGESKILGRTGMRLEWIQTKLPLKENELLPSYHSGHDWEIESPWRQIKELELEMRGWHRRRDYDHGSASDRIGGSSH